MVVHQSVFSGKEYAISPYPTFSSFSRHEQEPQNATRSVSHMPAAMEERMRPARLRVWMPRLAVIVLRKGDLHVKR